MPELPEVETVRRGLAPALTGRRITCAYAHRPDLRFALPQHFSERLRGARIEAVERRAKYLQVRLDTGETLVCHLGMSGRFVLADDAAEARGVGDFYFAAPPNPAHTHVELVFDSGARLAYNDPRRFGYMDLVPTAGLAAHPFFRKLGPEPLGPGFTRDALAAAFRGRRQSVKACLLDQRIVAGVGNIYACEALHRAAIAPACEAGALGARALARLVGAVRAVLLEAIEVGGSTLRDHAGADGARGAFQNAFRVYDREGGACVRRGCDGVVMRSVQNGRSTFHCPRCQRPPRIG